MQRGGRRVGAGRPAGSQSEKSLEREALRQYIFDQVSQNKEAIITALIKEATSGQVSAAKELLERCLGRVKGEPEVEVQEVSLSALLMEIRDERKQGLR